MDTCSLGKVADEYLGHVAVIVRDDMEIAVAVEVEDRGRAAGARGRHGDVAVAGGALAPLLFALRVVGHHGRLLAFADIVRDIRTIAVEGEPGLDHALARLDAENELC